MLNMEIIDKFFISNLSNLFIFFILTYILWLGFSPYLKLRFYANQGIQIFFVPFIGTVYAVYKDLQLKGDILATRKEIVKKDPNYRLMASHLGGDVIVHLADPVLIKEFYNNQEHYKKSIKWMGPLKLLMGNGLITLEKHEWKRQRRIISKLFHYDYTKSMIPHIVEISDELFTNLSTQSTLSNISIIQEFQKITGDVIGYTFFGKTLSNITVDKKSLSLEMASLFSDVNIITNSFWNIFFGYEFVIKGIIPSHKPILRRIERMKQVCNEILQERKKARLASSKGAVEDHGKGNSASAGVNGGESNSTNDGISNGDDAVHHPHQAQTNSKGGLIDLLLEIQSQDEHLTNEEIVDEIITFFIAGMDTTGHLCTFCVWMMTQYPDTIRKIQDELGKIIGNGMMNNLEDELRYLNLDNLNKLEYLTAFIKPFGFLDLLSGKHFRRHI